LEWHIKSIVYWVHWVTTWPSQIPTDEVMQTLPIDSAEYGPIDQIRIQYKITGHDQDRSPYFINGIRWLLRRDQFVLQKILARLNRLLVRLKDPAAAKQADITRRDTNSLQQIELSRQRQERHERYDARKKQHEEDTETWLNRPRGFMDPKPFYWFKNFTALDLHTAYKTIMTNLQGMSLPEKEKFHLSYATTCHLECLSLIRDLKYDLKEYSRIAAFFRDPATTIRAYSPWIEIIMSVAVKEIPPPTKDNPTAKTAYAKAVENQRPVILHKLTDKMEATNVDLDKTKEYLIIFDDIVQSAKHTTPEILVEPLSNPRVPIYGHVDTGVKRPAESGHPQPNKRVAK
jgi:hypothetical protein